MKDRLRLGAPPKGEETFPLEAELNTHFLALDGLMNILRLWGVKLTGYREYEEVTVKK